MAGKYTRKQEATKPPEYNAAMTLRELENLRVGYAKRREDIDSVILFLDNQIVAAAEAANASVNTNLNSEYLAKEAAEKKVLAADTATKKLENYKKYLVAAEAEKSKRLAVMTDAEKAAVATAEALGVAVMYLEYDENTTY